MRLTLIKFAGAALALLFASPVAGASGGAVDAGDSHGLQPLVLVGLAVMLIVAKLGGELFELFSQPAVLGELLGGILLGNLTLFGIASFAPLKTNGIIVGLAELGVILLLFEVGLHSDLKEMMEVGWSSLLVAVLGVVAPFFFGWTISAYFIPDAPRLAHIFIGATLCATSVGITARVFKDLDKLSTREARIILGAAVIDDVLGLLILALVAGAISASQAGAALSMIDIGIVAGKAVIFLAGSLALGHFVMPRLLRGLARLDTRGVLLTLAICFCLFMSWVAARAGLAPIVGAFAAGLVLDEVHYKPKHSRNERRLEDLLHPISMVLVPVFFVLMGASVDLRAFAQLNILVFALVLTLAAIIGKQICGLGVLERGANRLAVGIGMIPRGEVGLIFAGIGATLMLRNAGGENVPVIDSATFGAVVIMVVLTTLITPPALKWALRRKSEED